MPKLKKSDDYIIEDENTRLLLAALLSKWGDEQARSIVEEIKKRLEKIIQEGEARLLSECNKDEDSYTRESYNIGTGHKTIETIRERTELRRRQLDEAFSVLQLIFGESIKQSLWETLQGVVQIAGNVPIKAAEKRIRAADAQRKRRSGRRIKEAIGSVFGNEKHWGRPEIYTKEYVERRSIEIMRYLGADSVTVGRVAVAFYCGLKRFKKGDREKLLQIYEAMDANEHRKLIRRYKKLIKDKELVFENLKARASTHISLRRKRR